ncbi:MAG: T9SS type A sorting domain-containing protein [Bacteroidetes bacterium]|nr:T9SS type A sorting domain-containing protein [Bacteroidota bacterium]
MNKLHLFSHFQDSSDIKLKKTGFLVLLVTLFFQYSIAQTNGPEIISSSGNHFSNATATISWTIGETIIETESNASVVLTQGFHQPNYSIVSINELNNFTFDFDVYPNPASDFVKIRANSLNPQKREIRIFDLQGNLIILEDFSANEITINLKNLAASTYLITIHSQNQELLSSYQLIKHN